MNVTLLEHMGSDLSVCNAARVSFAKESDWDYQPTRDHYDYQRVLSDRDAKLIRYLAKHNHWTPFGHAFASFRIKAPIFVARQLGKHQVGLVWNEVSRRYVDSDPEFYIPSGWRKRADNVKQGSSDEVVDDSESFSRIDTFVRNAIDEVEDAYLNLLSRGVAPEMARIVLPQNTYTEWVWSGSLAAFARVCKLRLDPHTQKETRDIAEMIDVEMRRLFPVSWGALQEA